MIQSKSLWTPNQHELTFASNTPADMCMHLYIYIYIYTYISLSVSLPLCGSQKGGPPKKRHLHLCFSVPGSWPPAPGASRPPGARRGGPGAWPPPAPASGPPPRRCAPPAPRTRRPAPSPWADGGRRTADGGQRTAGVRGRPGMDGSRDKAGKAWGKKKRGKLGAKQRHKLLWALRESPAEKAESHPANELKRLP